MEHPKVLTLDDVAKEYVRLAVALGERDPDGLDFYSGPLVLVSDIRRNPPRLPEIKTSALTASANLGVNVSEERHNFLAAQLRALAFRTDQLAGVNRPFNEESEALFGITPGSPDEPSLSATRIELERLLPGQGPLVNRYAAFEKAFLIPPDNVPEVMRLALTACRQKTLQHFSLPPAEKVSFEYVRNKPWSAFSRYLGNSRSVIQVNADLGLTVDRALQLACHEGYPGHHVFNTLREEGLAKRENRIEFTVQPTFSPQSLISEAAATYGAELAFTAPERLRIEREILFPAAGLRPARIDRCLRIEQLVAALHPAELAIARDYVDGKLEFFRAASALENRTLMQHPEGMLRYLNEFRTYSVTYTEGRDRLAQWLGEHYPNKPWDGLREVILDRGAAKGVNLASRGRDHRS